MHSISEAEKAQVFLCVIEGETEARWDELTHPRTRPDQWESVILTAVRTLLVLVPLNSTRT